MDHGHQPAPGPPARVAVVLAAPNGPMRDALRAVLAAEANLELAGEAEDVPTALRRARDRDGAVLVLDLVIARGFVLEAIRRLRRAAPWTPIVALSMENAPAFARHALAGGADAFVLADRADRDLADAIRRVAGATPLPHAAVG